MNISGILERFGIQNERLIEVINVLFTMLVVSLIGWLAYVVAKKFLPKLIKKIAVPPGSTGANGCSTSASSTAWPC